MTALPFLGSSRRRSAEQLQFLRQSARLEESAAPFHVRRTGFVLSALVWAFLLWAGLTKIEEITQAPGEIVPSGFTQIVQHYEGGIVRKINVREGALVKQGDTLLLLDGAGTQEDLNKEMLGILGYQRDVGTAEQMFKIQEKLEAQGLSSKVRYLLAKQKLSQALNQLEQQHEVVARLKGRVGRLAVKAPVSGIVKGLKINTVGEVVKPGEALMEFVPVDEDLIVAVHISPSDIGHIAVGQSVKVKVSSYDYGRFGAVEGTLTFITATTFTGNKGEKYYRGNIKLKRNYVGENQELKLLPGMTVQAGIITGEKTILQYLLKPVQRALEDGLSER